MAREILCLSAGKRREFNFVLFYGDLLWACLISPERRLISTVLDLSFFFHIFRLNQLERSSQKRTAILKIYFLSFITQNIQNVEAFEFWKLNKSHFRQLFVNAPRFLLVVWLCWVHYDDFGLFVFTVLRATCDHTDVIRSLWMKKFYADQPLCAYFCQFSGIFGYIFMNISFFVLSCIASRSGKSAKREPSSSKQWGMY